MKYLFNIIINIFRGNYLLVILSKILKRLEKNTEIESRDWALSNTSISINKFLQNLDNSLFTETIIEIKKIEYESKKKLSLINLSLGGGGHYTLLYFLVRKFKPNIVIETGVAAGWSSLSILRALKKNKNGKLFSSDFPYFRFKEPEKYIGILVKDESNYNDWHLNIKGDSKALREFVTKIPNKTVKIFHYDSDKSYTGRSNAFNIIKNKLTDDPIIIFDDIQNNFHFRDLVKKLNTNFKVFEFKGKFVGVIGV